MRSRMRWLLRGEDEIIMTAISDDFSLMSDHFCRPWQLKAHRTCGSCLYSTPTTSLLFALSCVHHSSLAQP
jgi:hypothetical protein